MNIEDKSFPLCLSYQYLVWVLSVRRLFLHWSTRFCHWCSCFWILAMNHPLALPQAPHVSCRKSLNKILYFSCSYQMGNTDTNYTLVAWSQGIECPELKGSEPCIIYFQLSCRELFPQGWNADYQFTEWLMVITLNFSYQLWRLMNGDSGKRDFSFH